MKIVIIVAMAESRVIGRDNAMPWHLPDDLKRFKALTVGHPVVMGRKTHESIGRLLPKRENVILTRRKDYGVEGATICHSPEEVLERFGDAEQVFIIGGEEIYRAFLDRADRIHLTVVHREVEGDTWFPEFDGALFAEASKEFVPDPIPHSFVVLERK